MRGSAKTDPFDKSGMAKAEPPTFKSGANLPAIEDSEDFQEPSNKENGGFPGLNGMKKNAVNEN